ncbi:hypothetical protein APHAL10511_000659 [Amanita phalloides]|nr:hypothetical protein APHAL10511_000659 [Amanita phalloides]
MYTSFGAEERNGGHKQQNGTPTGSQRAKDEFILLDDAHQLTNKQKADHELCTAPILTAEAYTAVGGDKFIRQYGVFGKVIEIGGGTSSSNDRIQIPKDGRLYLNTNTPFSAVVCGVQGSGKSHTVSVMLEDMLVPDCSLIGHLQQPLAGLVLHYSNGGQNTLPSEAAYIGVPRFNGIKAPQVDVYVPKSSLNTLKGAYAHLGTNIKVQSLYFDENELDAEAFLSMMAVESLESAPLYMQTVMSILRDLGEQFTFTRFQQKLNTHDFSPTQRAMLDQRMALLNSFVSKIPRKSRFSQGRLTIIDLSDPFIDASSACSVFEIIVRLFVRAKIETGKVILVDEAHKYLEQGTTNGLVKSLLKLIREQRHLAMRVLVSTQEPTVIPPVILDLCSVMVLHRFSSPEWWQHLRRHICAQISQGDAFDKIVGLETGQAMVLSPSGLTTNDEDKSLILLRRLYVLMKTRKRVTLDGGTSALAVGSTKIP